MMGTAFYSDEEFHTGIRRGDPVAERAFYDQNFKIVGNLLHKMDTRRTILVEDLYQDVITVVFLKIKEGGLEDRTAKLSTFVYSVARNMILDRFKKDKRSITVAPIEDAEVPEEESSEMDMDALEMAALEMVKQLRPPCDEIIMDWYIHQLSYEEIAEKHKYKNANTAKKKKGDCMTEARIRCEKILNAQ